MVANLSFVFHAGLSSNNHAFACSCIAPQSPSIALLESEAVFSGELTEVRTQTDVYQKIVTMEIDMHTRLGNLWSIEGTMTGEDTSYELHYAAISHGLRTQAVVDETAATVQ